MKPRISALAVLLLFAAIYAASATNQPNIVLIIADDLGAEDCGPFGNKKVRTPNLDRLAAEGMRFDRAFLTCSSCSPSRASILTGRYPHQTGAEQLHWPVPPEQVGFTELLRKKGYWTAAVGKWHLGNSAKTKFDLVQDKPAPIPTSIEKKKRKQLEREAHSGCTQWIPVIQNRPKDKPFFLWLASFDPHRDYEPNTIPEPHVPEDVTVPVYIPDTPAVRKDFDLYYDEISRLDRYVGEVLKELEKQGVLDNTLIAFLSDNGRPFPRCKTTILDSGIRTPLIIRWPGKIQPRSSTTSLVSSIDLAPTFLSIAGVSAPTNFVGINFSDLFTNPKKTVREQIFAEHNWHDYEARSRAIRTDRFKYIHHDYNDLPGTPPADAVRSPTFQEMRHLRDESKLTASQMVCFTKPGPKEELFDLNADPDELKNLSGDKNYVPVLNQMRATLERWAQETDDRVPAERTPDSADRETGQHFKGSDVHGRTPPLHRHYLDKFQIP